MNTPIKIAVSGAAGQISYSLIFRLAVGDLLGPDQLIHLSLLEVPEMVDALKGIAMELDASIFTKSGIMVGLGEERNEVLQLMDDLRSADVDFLTIGQYLQPTKKHHAVIDYIHPDQFKAYETIAYTKGFLLVSATPLTRSSHHAGEDFARLKAAREASLKR